ncbi:Psf2-domain-containing protein [Sistotremastrum niveocremeum HHB9708]|uniref:DNA replication complex GINS protein PSF2 n=1 Tax=Sistotremastrum niveocremeum HHB9708 TaxID=1314777 RepID=A0A164ZUF9_9AGAM|nr:Psf2-domain-containing protein [Sistotremastrum niveocremeum HHB9708]
MFDPLSSPFEVNAANTPPWPTTPHSPQALPPALRKTPHSPLPNSTPASPFGKEPQIYGQPAPGLISPAANTASNGTKFEKPGPYLRVRVVALDRNRRDLLIRMDAQTNLPNFNGQTYRNISRSYLEFQQFAEQIVYCNPQTIVPALPLAQTSAPTDEEDDRLVKIMLQRWLTRICEDPVIIKEDEVRSFIESDFGYQPTVRPKRKTSAGFSLLRRGPPDEDETLQRARFELTKLEGQFFEAAKAIDKLSKSRKVMSHGHAEMGNKLINVATTEAHPSLAAAFRKFGRTWHSVGDLENVQAISECVILGDCLGYQGLNAKSAKETLQNRTQVLEEYQAAVKSSISKRRHIERLKASTNIRPDRVDEALEDMEEATKYEEVLAKRVDGISNNLHRALKTHSRTVNEDFNAALIEHVRSTLMYEKQHLRELESLRPDFAAASKKIGNGVKPPPAPIVVPPQSPTSPTLPASTSVSRVPASSSTASASGSSTGRPSSAQPALPPSLPTAVASSSARPRSPVVDPLGGPGVTQSMVLPPNARAGPSTQTFGRAGPSVSSASATPSAPTPPPGQNQSYMSQSMRLPPQRNRLDAREAARYIVIRVRICKEFSIDKLETCYYRHSRRMPSVAAAGPMPGRRVYVWVALASVSTLWLTQWQSVVVSKHRKLSGIKYPQVYAEKAEVAASPAALKFNCAQRAHQNTLESYAQNLFAILFTGLKYPLLASGLGAAYTFGRILYTLGYVSGDPSKRTSKGGFIGSLAAIACEELIDIVPLFSMNRIRLISGVYGPFRPPAKARVPLWMASNLKLKKRCRIIPPDWLTERLTEETTKAPFSELPFRYAEMAKVLLDVASDDIESPDKIMSLLKDLRDARQAKSREGLRKLDGIALSLPNLCAMEINEIRPFFVKAMHVMIQLTPEKQVEAPPDDFDFDQF